MTWGALTQSVRLLVADEGQVDDAIGQAAWIARCVGRGDLAPLRTADVAALAERLQTRDALDAQVVFRAGEATAGVWLVRSGQVELSVGVGADRTAVGVLRPGDVDGDLGLLLSQPHAYTARSIGSSRCLYLAADDFEWLLATHASIARRWLSSVAQRLAAEQSRVLSLIGRSLPEQTASLLLDHAVEGKVSLPQRTLAAMLGVTRPSLNKVLKDLERRGAVRIEYAAVVVDPARLREAVEQRRPRRRSATGSARS